VRVLPAEVSHVLAIVGLAEGTQMMAKIVGCALVGV
jgi:hypothetical protein